MADQLNMNGLSLNESKHAGAMPARSAYIPPHMRNQAGGPPPMNMDGKPPGAEVGLGGSAWGNTAYVSEPFCYFVCCAIWLLFVWIVTDLFIVQ
jgi:hypothetical protein